MTRQFPPELDASDYAVANRIRARFPLTAAILDAVRIPHSGRYQRFVRQLDNIAVWNHVPSIFA